MKLLVGIVNFGTKNDEYLKRVLENLRAIPIEKDIVVFVDKPKSLGSDIEVRVGVPPEGPLFMPVLPRRLFQEKAGQYDVYINLEDDTPIEERHVRAFVSASESCDANTVPGFLRWEYWPDGTVHVDTLHRNFSWLPSSPTRVGQWVFAELSNLQAAVMMLTQPQLERAMASPHFDDRFQPTRLFQLIERASAQLFQECGLKRVIPVSHIDDFLFPHLANRFHLHRIGLLRARFDEQIQALIKSADNKRACQTLVEPFTKLAKPQWDKNFDEFDTRAFLSHLEAPAKDVLWIGASGSDAERAVVELGHRMTGIPLDSVVAASALGIGMQVTSASFDGAFAELDGRAFDAIIAVNMLERLADPVASLRMMRKLLRSGGKIISSVPNFDRLWRFPNAEATMENQTGFSKPWDYSETGIHYTTKQSVKSWFDAADLRAKVECRLADGCRRYHLLTLGLLKHKFSDTLVVVATK